MEPKISIITITYNSEATLDETILSVTMQAYPALEYVIIDGGSTDGTLDIIQKYKDKIQIVVSEPDHGISDAFNKGITKATGEIIGIINSDDILLPGALQKVAEEYDPKVDVYSGHILFWDVDTDETFSSYPDVTFDTLKLQYNVAHPARFIRKDAYERYGLYREDLRYMMDIELPATLKRIQNGAFLSCDALQTVYFDGTRQQWDSVVIEGNNDVLSKCTVICKG